MAGLGAPARWRHAVVGATVLAGPVLVLAGCLGRPLDLERYDARQVLVQPAGDVGLRVRETVDQDFGSFDRHGYERRIPNDFGVPTDVEASSPDAPAAVSVEPDPVRIDWTRIRIGDPDVTVSGQHRYVLSYTLPDVRLGDDGRLHLDIIDAGEPFPTDDFEVVVAGLELADPQCDVGAAGAAGGCELVADGDVYRADIGRLDTDQGVSISATVVSRTEVAPPTVPPIPDRRTDTSAVPLAALILPIGAAGAGGIYALMRRRGRNEVYAGGAADAAYGMTTLPPPGAPPLPVRRVADERMGDLATIEFVPPRGIAPWQGRVLVREQIDSDAASAWFSGLAAQDVLTLVKADDDGDDHVIVAKGPRFEQADATDAAILRPMFEGADALTLDGYDEGFAKAWSAALAEMRRSTAASGWWKRRAPGSRSIATTVALGVVGVVVLVFFLFVVVVLSLLLGPPGAIAFAIVVPAAVAFGLYRSMLPSRSAAGSALALRTESFRRFLVASEGRHVDWAWSHGLLREYSAWAVALGAADVWQRAMERSSVPPAELATGPLLVWSMGPAFSSGHTAPTSSGGGGWGGGGGGGFSGGVGGGGGGGSSGSW